MIRILHTGDLHIGREYKKQPAEISERYKNARLESLHNAVRLACENDCNYLVIAGDLFDSKTISATLMKTVCAELAGASCQVLVLPGNHDYYEGEDDKLWNAFRDCAGENTVLLMEEKPYFTDNAVFYPCPCNDRYSVTNALGWLSEDVVRDSNLLNIGLAHGALEGLSCDREKRYYAMTQQELEDCAMDLWLLGHTHIPFPNREIITNERIFNAGTPQQTDIADNAEGTVFLIEAEKRGCVTAHKLHTGVIRFSQLFVHISREQALDRCLSDVLLPYKPTSTALRIIIDGTACAEDYSNREKIYRNIGSAYLQFEIRDEALRQEINAEMIDNQTLEGSIENQLLKRYLKNPDLLDTAFALVKKCMEEK